MNRLRERYPLLFFIIFFVIFFRKVLFQGLLPIPSDLLVSFYFPFSSGGFPEYSQWVPNKAQVADDSIRQQYPWKVFTANAWKQGEIPLWNPYAFSGYPIMANVQSGVFYPFNVLFVLLNTKLAWTILVLIQPILSALFMYQFLKSLKVVRLAAIFGSLIFIGMSFELLWMEQMIIGHTTLWLPLILLSIQKLSETNKKWFLVGVIGVVMSILGGYSQTTIYVFIISAFFLLIKCFMENNLHKRMMLFIVVCMIFILGIGLSAIQLIPTAEIYKYSAREGKSSEELYGKSLAPTRNILTILTQDFYGNVATYNYWGDQHTDFNHFFGTIPLLLVISGVYYIYRKKIDLKEGGWFLILGLGALLCSLNTPFGYTPLFLKIPILSTGVVARFLFVFQFSMAIVATMTLSYLIQNRNLKISLRPFIFTFSIFLTVIMALFVFTKTSSSKGDVAHILISLKNMIFSLSIITLGIVSLLLTRILKAKNLGFSILIIFTAFEFIYLGNKYLPFAKKEYLFPQHPLFTYLQKNAGINRFWGSATTYVTTNFPSVYGLHYTEGYDSLYIKRYGELVYSSRDGSIPEAIPRSDVNLSPNKESWQYREKMLDVLGIKYVLDKNDNPTSNFEPDNEKFPPNRYQLIWQEGKFKIYENLKALPRIYFADKIILKRNSKEIIDEILTGNHLDKFAVVEEPINLNIKNINSGNIQLVKYSLNKITLSTSSPEDKLLVLTDNYFPGWYAKIDGVSTKIYRTNYTFRGIIVPKGNHTIVFEYKPMSFKIGIFVSLIFLFLTAVVVKKIGTKNDYSRKS